MTESKNAKLWHRRLRKFVSDAMPLHEANILLGSFRECEVVLGVKNGKEYIFKKPEKKS